MVAILAAFVYGFTQEAKRTLLQDMVKKMIRQLLSKWGDTPNGGGSPILLQNAARYVIATGHRTFWTLPTPYRSRIEIRGNWNMVCKDEVVPIHHKVALPALLR
jgi:hypothetical protein